MINVIKLYELVSHSVKIDTVTFCDLINACVGEICAKYGDNCVLDGEKTSTRVVDDKINVHDEYFGAICAYILANAAGADINAFMLKADAAYHTVWKRLSRGMRKHRDFW